ncbi:hypothetical protein H072_3604 [Dactylellina haptotyla CBS 200.50]|uniref:Thiaminase-2/PQQC domain-containing protein n=1 Tax=Dactylellina haptotyla (strain CBS 200.50) TaxID=1284197 RepID=S8AHB9_DACHA|nr:hypothetical protein H072_3604 [Dactylellina haptotyla CBS 200.50]
MSIPPSKLTTYLLALSPTAYTSATTHPFLSAAANSSLPTQKLLQWLLQDRHYALSYISFISLLLSKLRIPTTSNRTDTLTWRVADTLIFSLNNIKTELSLFDSVLREEFSWRSDEEVEVLPITRAYGDLFAGCGAAKVGVLEGMVVLWATERCYFDAWGFAKRCILDTEGSSGGGGGSSADVEEEKGKDVLKRVFIPNWTSEEFGVFVDTLGTLVDEIAEAEGVAVGGEEWRRCEEIWRQVLSLEERFWPTD